MNEFKLKDHIFDWDNSRGNNGYILICEICGIEFELLTDEYEKQIINEKDYYFIDFPTCEESILDNVI